MGSIDKACISGFLCRLCSEMHRTVIHIYGDQGKRLGLVQKINGYLPITISPTDPLPKTICQSCLRRVEQHYDLLLRLSRIKEGRYLRVYPRIGRQNLNREVAVHGRAATNNSNREEINSENNSEQSPEDGSDQLEVEEAINDEDDTDDGEGDALESEDLILRTIEIDLLEDNNDVEADETNGNMDLYLNI